MTRYRTITVFEPHASLLAWGEKRFETRTRSARELGISLGERVAIHAGKAFDAERQFLITAPVFGPREARVPNLIYQSFVQHHAGVSYVQTCTLGRVLAVATLVGCHRITTDKNGAIGYFKLGRFTEASVKEQAFGDWGWGRWAWEFKDIGRGPAVRGLGISPQATGRQGAWWWEDTDGLFD